MTSFGYPLGYWDWDDCSGYVPPNSDLARRATLDDLPAPVYDANPPGPYVPQVDWAEALIELAIERYGVDHKGNYGGGPGQAVWCPDCECGWTSRVDQPCWFCHPQPAPQLILPVSASDRRW